MKSHTLTLPARLDVESLVALENELAQVSEPSVVVLRGASDEVFCEGLDLNSFRVEAALRERGLTAFEQILRHLLAESHPTLALVRGRALGGGCGLAAACDVAVALDESRFGLPEPLFGLVPGLITPVLLTRIMPATLRRLALSGESFDSATALNAGLIDACVDINAFERTERYWTRRLRRPHPPAVRRLKSWLFDQGRLESEIRVGREHLETLFESAEVRERISRFEIGEVPWES